MKKQIIFITIVAAFLLFGCEEKTPITENTELDE